MQLINLTFYQPETAISGVVYLQDENGIDWYQAQEKFSPETLKICVGDQQKIVACHHDVSTLWPINMSVFEVEADKVPQGLAIDGNWGWDGEKIVSLITLESEQQKKIEEIKKYRDQLTADYIIIDEHHFHSDTASRIQQATLCKMGQAGQIPAGLMWQSKNNGLIELTNQIAARFESETIAHDMRLFANAQRHIAAVEALRELQAVSEYDYKTGWQP
ncbi:DUF4376 domain-containing protein [Serratia microhaemolytica]|uniref:DUF4376 domain-containing protein n=1 Tax=Serratia microhaemolytica TaxID=2675110 RepID=UPI000FDD95FF|nr:DUF4376 domain-containing protein [Serratia microhaemolytica]